MTDDEFKEALDELAENDQDLWDSLDEYIELYGYDATKKYYEAIRSGMSHVGALDLLEDSSSPEDDELEGLSQEFEDSEEEDENGKSRGIMDQINDYLDRE